VANVAFALPQPQASLVRNSIGAAAEVATRLGGFDGKLLMSGASHAFIDAMNVTLIAAAGVALFGALVSLVFLPAEENPEPRGAEEPKAPSDIRQPEMTGSRQ
jgi:hypothetical protein